MKVARHTTATAAIAIVLAAFALTFQMWAFEDFPPYPYYDEVYTVTSAQYGFEDPTKLEISHPPLAPYVIKLSILAWGDSPTTWRIPSRICGALTIVLILLISSYLTGRLLPGTLASVLLLSDGVFITTTRAALYESQFIFLSFAALLATLYSCALQARPRLQTAGLAFSALLLGLALATKWSAALFIPCIAYVLFITLPVQRASLTVSMLIGITVATYTAVCCALTDQNAQQLLNSNLELLSAHLHPAAHHRYESPGWSWPLLIRPIWFGIDIAGPTARGTLCLGNPIVFLIALLASATLGTLGVRWLFTQRNKVLAMRLLPVVGFLATWLPWCALSQRRGFLYYYLPSLIFGCLSFATLINLVPVQRRWLKRVAIGSALLSIPVGILYLPLYVGLPVPFEWMRTLLPFRPWW